MDRACRPPHSVPNVAFCTYKKTNSLSCLPAAKAQTRRARHTETAGPWGTDRACGPRPPLPNVAFWTYKKASWPDLSSSRQSSHTARLPRQNSTVLRDGPGLRATAATTCLPAAKAHTGRARHTETAGPRGTDGACGPRPPLPNVAFWTYKKSSCLT